MTVLRVERVVAGGDGLARETSGRVVFVPGALPGEQVRVGLGDERRDHARASVVEVLEASPHRREPPCPYVAAGCGGCTWQHVDPPHQVELKRAIVEEALARTGGLRGVDVRCGPGLDPWQFRTTLRLGVDDGRLGFRARRSHRVVTVERCLVAHPLLDDLLVEARFPGAREVVLRAGRATGERLALVDPAVAAAGAEVATDVARGPGAAVHEVIAGQRLRVSAGSFFQTRADGAEALVAAVREAAGASAAGPGPGLVVDAYGGVGLFAATVAGDAPVEVVERSRSSCADARHNLAGRPARVVCTAVERWRPRRAGLVVADPARAGLGRAAVEVVAATRAPRLVLVSCDPVALARDTRLLAAAGYAHRGSTVIDLFPHTPHVEVVTRFDRATSPRPSR